MFGFLASKNLARRHDSRATRLRFEILEERTLLAFITWENRGAPGDDSDRFEDVFGGDAEKARNAVDAALHAWEEVIDDFHFRDFQNNPLPNNFYLTLSMREADDENALGHGGSYIGGSALPDFNGKPLTGEILLDRGGDGQGSGWYLDDHPEDSMEFRGQIQNAFVATPTSGGPADGLYDLFSVVTIEMNHALGINRDDTLAFQNSPFIASTGIPDAKHSPGELFVFDGVNVDALLTSYNSGDDEDEGKALHVAEPHAQNLAFSGGIPFYGARDVGNGGYGPGRYYPSRLSARMLEEVYHYDIVEPATNGTFYTNFEPLTGQLLIRGGETGEAIYGSGSPSDDTILIQRDQTGVIDLLVVTTFIGNSIPGTLGLEPYVTKLPWADVKKIIVVAGDGNDSITLDFSGGDIIPELMAIDAGSHTNPGFDTLQLFGTDYDDHIKLLSGELDISGPEGGAAFIANAEAILIRGYGGDDTVQVEDATGYLEVDVLGDQGDDTIELSSIAKDLDAIASPIIVSGGFGDDTVRVFDDSDTENHFYQLSKVNYSRDSFALLGYDTIETLEINASQGPGKNHEILSTAAGTETTINAPTGTDLFLVDSNGFDDPNNNENDTGVVNGVQSMLRINGGGGGIVGDQVRLIDLSESTSTTVTVTSSTVGVEPGDNFFGPGGFLVYDALTRLELRLGRPADTVRVHSTSPGTYVAILAGLGDDFISVSTPGLLDPDTHAPRGGTVDAIHSVVDVIGDLGNDTLKVDDSGSLAGKIATVDATTVGAGSADNFFGGGYVVYHTVETLQVLAGTVGDQIHILSTAAAQGVFPGTETFVFGGDGDDAIDVGPHASVNGDTVDLIGTKLSINGQDGADSLVLRDSSDTSGDAVAITPSQVGQPGDTFFGTGGFVVYASLSFLELQMGSGSNGINVRGTAAGTSTVVTGSTGADHLVVDSNGALPGGSVDGVLSPLTFNGGGGKNTVSLRDDLDATADVVTITDSHVGIAGDSFFGAQGTMNYSGVSILQLMAGTGGDTIYVRGTNSGTLTQVFAGGGADTVFVDNNLNLPGGSVDGVRSPLEIDGGGGLNTLTLEDSSDTTPDQVTVTFNSIGAGAGDKFFGLGGKLKYGSFNSITINGGAGGNKYTIQSTPPLATVTINGGDGSDTIAVDSNGPAVGGSANSVLGPIKINGQGGTFNRLTLEDSSDTLPNTVTVVPMTANTGLVNFGVGDNLFGPGGNLVYTGLTTLLLNMGNTAGDTINLSPSPTLTGTGFIVDGNKPSVSNAGDTLHVNLNGVVSPVHVKSLSTGIGKITSATHAPITYEEIETVTGAPPAMIVAAAVSVRDLKSSSVSGVAQTLDALLGHRRSRTGSRLVNFGVAEFNPQSLARGSGKSILQLLR